jgi:hypothetical protein
MVYIDQKRQKIQAPENCIKIPKIKKKFWLPFDMVTTVQDIK